MEIKAILNKPFEENDRLNFIVEQNYQNGYEIKEVETGLEAWGYTNDELSKQEQERIAKLHLTKREVFLGLRKAKNILPEQIRSQITDPDSLIEFDYATEYYRGNPLIDKIGLLLNLNKTQIDNFFKTSDYKALI